LVQVTSSMRLVIASIRIFPAFRSAPPREAAAPAWQTESLMSLGDSQKPARYTPRVGASTARLGVRSMKPSVLKT
jgi:hypothetical protein